MYGAEIAERTRFIMAEEIPQRWGRAVLLREQGAGEQASQQTIKVCAGTRAIVVYSAALRGVARPDASEESFRMYDKFTGQLTIDAIQDFEKSLRIAKFADAFQLPCYDYESRDSVARPAFLAGIGITIAHLIEQQRNGMSMHLPQPGLPSGEIVSWEPADS